MKTNPPTSPQRKSCLARLLKAALILLVLAALVLAALQINQRVGLANFRQQNPPPGQLFTINGHAMHLYCLGSASPTVIIDAGNGSYSLEWMPIQEQLSANLRVCTFDRPGYGWSEATSARRDGAQVVREIHDLLQAAGERAPFILVGHSLGGLHVRLYAAQYPEEVAGLALIETAGSLEITPGYEQQMATTIGVYRVMQMLSGSGLMRLLGAFGGADAMPANARKMPANIQEIYLQMTLDPAQYTTAIAEMEQIPTTFQQTQDSSSGEWPYGDMPLMVLTAALTYAPGATPFDERLVAADAQQIERQVALAQLSSRGQQRVIDGSGHLMHLDAPQAIIQALLDLQASLP